jgi:FtsP/CotA-like multicopper oxidase with cupredoxin domain
MKSFVVSVAAVVTMFVWASETAAETQKPLPGRSIPQFAQPLPLLSAAGGTMATLSGNTPLTIRMCEFDANVLPPGAITPNVETTTRVWGYVAGNCPTTAQDTYIGPVIVNVRGTPTPITFINDLGNTATTGVLAYKNSTDQTLHWADPANDEANACEMAEGFPEPGSPCAQNYSGSIPAAVHLHGGEVPPELDGGPDSWVTSDGAHRGHGYYSFPAAPSNGSTYRYPNTQPASPIWFHDHTLGATRLNVYAGLAGVYLIVDPALDLPATLPGPAGVIPIVLQDRMFDTNGQLFFPADSAGGTLWTPDPEHPYWVPEFVGDTIVVNGKAWPYLEVEPKRYRFLFLNGSNARTYEMFLPDGRGKNGRLPLFVIGSDGGYLDAPARLRELTMMPGERYEVIIDFSKAAPGARIVLRNVAKTPYPSGEAPGGRTIGRILQFRVGPCVSGACGKDDPSYDPSGGEPLRTEAQRIVRLADPSRGSLATGVTVDATRQLTLNEIASEPSTAIDPVTGSLTDYPGGPVEILLNNTEWSGMSSRTYGDFTPITVGANTTFYSELPREGDTELWEIVNLTADAHPIHLHLVQYQLVNRQRFSASRYARAYASAFPGGDFLQGFGPPLDYRPAENPLSGGKFGGNPDVSGFLQGPVRAPSPRETGWKDTVMAPPGMVTRIAVRWAPLDLPTTAAKGDLHYAFDPNDGFQHGYVWHCHIIDHEDNEMMRPDLVELNPLAPAPSARPLKKGVDY